MFLNLSGKTNDDILTRKKCHEVERTSAKLSVIKYFLSKMASFLSFETERQRDKATERQRKREAETE